MLKFTKSGDWQFYWGYTPLPAGAEALGTIQRETLEKGALIRLSTGIYVQGNANAIRTLDQSDVVEALARSEAASTLGRTGGAMTSEAKASAARANGKRGGRPRKQAE